MKKRTAFILSIFLLLNCFVGCKDIIIKTFEGLPNVKLVVRRISGMSFLKFSKGDPSDGFSAQNGFLCVTHNPGCAPIFGTGNDGKDKIFNTLLPPLCTIVGHSFIQYWPIGINTGASGGGLFGGSYGAQLTAGDALGNTPWVVRWNNSCVADFGGKSLHYQISFLVSMPENLDIGEPTFDQGVDDPTVCLPDGFCTNTQTTNSTFCEGKTTTPPPNNPTPVPVSPSGFDGQVKYCNQTTATAVGTLHIVAKLVTPVPGAQGATTMTEDIAVSFGQSGGGQPSVSGFKTLQNYQQGTWQILTGTILKGLSGNLNLQGVPITVQLPGIITTPILDFSHGTCN